jgi:hypothetical protein
MIFFNYNIMTIKSIFPFLFSLVLLLSISSCNKEVAATEQTVSYQLLAEKTWYLQYAQTST